MLGMFRQIVDRFPVMTKSRSKDIEAEAIPNIRVPMGNIKTVPELLDKLDARKQPGITENEFSRLFARCGCGLVTTRRAFRDHRCRVVIDLTGDA
jgi:hypothetical protein